MKAGRSLTMRVMVELAGVSRASYYRYHEDSAAAPEGDMDVREAIQRDCGRMAQLWASTDHSGTPPAGLDGESETGLPVGV